MSHIPKEVVVKLIAQLDLHIDNLETRNSDELDFHDIHVADIKQALETAYDEGKRSNK